MTWAGQIEASRPVGGRYVCIPCRDEPTDECGDHCGTRQVHELPPVITEWWPTCSCCGRDLFLAGAAWSGVDLEAPNSLTGGPLRRAFVVWSP